MQNTSWTYKQFALCITRHTAHARDTPISHSHTHTQPKKAKHICKHTINPMPNKNVAQFLHWIRILHAQTQLRSGWTRLGFGLGQDFDCGLLSCSLLFFRWLLLWYVHYFYLSQWMRNYETKRNESNRAAKGNGGGRGQGAGGMPSWHTNMQNS